MVFCWWKNVLILFVGGILVVWSEFCIFVGNFCWDVWRELFKYAMYCGYWWWCFVFRYLWRWKTSNHYLLRENLLAETRNSPFGKSFSRLFLIRSTPTFFEHLSILVQLEKWCNYARMKSSKNGPAPQCFLVPFNFIIFRLTLTVQYPSENTSRLSRWR